MKLKRVVTLFTAIVAVSTALAGTAGARNLLAPAAGWYADEAGTIRLDTQQAEQDCQNNSPDTCGYYFNGTSEVGSKSTFDL